MIFQICRHHEHHDGYSLNTWLLEHDGKSARQFQNDVAHAIKTVAGNYLANEDNHADIDRWIDAAVKRLTIVHGYTLLEPCVFDIDSPTFIDRHFANVEGTSWREVVGDDIFEKMLVHNDAVWAERE